MSDQARAYIGGDYAGIKTPTAKFYYGYERTTGSEDGWEDGEWCFVATIDGAEHVLPFSELGLPQNENFSCALCIMQGIAVLIARSVLSVQFAAPTPV